MSHLMPLIHVIDFRYSLEPDMDGRTSKLKTVRTAYGFLELGRFLSSVMLT